MKGILTYLSMISGCLVFLHTGVSAQVCANQTLDFFNEAILAQTPVEFTSVSLRSFRLVDIDGDQDLDLFVLAELGSQQAMPESTYPMVYQFENSGTTEMADFQLLEQSIAYALEEQSGFNQADWVQIDFVDIDNDGDQDLFLSGLTPPIVGRNTGTVRAPELQLQFIPGLEMSEYYTFASFADLNADGFPDAVTSSDNGVTLLMHNADPVNPAYVLAPEDWSNFGVSGNWLADLYLYPAILMDMDGDGDMDLYGQGGAGENPGWSEEVTWVTNWINWGYTYQPSFEASPRQFYLPYNGAVPFAWPSSPQRVDYNGDGRRDIVHLHNNRLMVRLNTGTERFPYFEPLSADQTVQVNLQQQSAGGGLKEVTLTMTNLGSSSKQFALYTATSATSIQTTKGPFNATLGAGETKFRRFTVPVNKPKMFSIQLNSAAGELIACQSLPLLN